MARKPRIHYPGAVYHVIVRGNAGQDIFSGDQDRYRFYLFLQEGQEKFAHLIHAFCLMTNHVHLILQVQEISLSRILQNLNQRYTIWVNWGEGRRGHLFLAVMLSDLIRQNLGQDTGKIKLFNSLDAKVLIEARDIQITVGLEFKQARLTVSEGFSVKPDIHIIAGSSTILDLCLLKIKFGLPYFFDGAGFKVLKKLLARKLIIKGLFRHFSTLVKLTELFSVI